MVYFSIQYIHTKRVFKRVSHFFLLLCSFWEISIYLSPRASFNYILKECLISKDLQIIRKKADIVLISIYSSCIAENFKAIRYCIGFGTWSSLSTPLYNNLKKQSSNFTSLVALNFSLKYDITCYHLIFHVPNFLIALIN